MLEELVRENDVIVKIKMCSYVYKILTLKNGNKLEIINSILHVKKILSSKYDSKAYA